MQPPAILSGKRALAAMSLVLMAWLLNACETLPPANTASIANASVTSRFLLSGRLSIRAGERLDSVKLVWRKDQHEERLQFFTPFGSQLAEVSQIDGGIATLRQGKDVLTAESLGILTESFLGIALDTGEIGQWVQGVGLNDGEPRELRLRDGSIWRVTAERMQSAAVPERPDTVFRYAARLTAVKGDITIRLVVDEWRAL
ncbi:MAG TPA: outer membrane lipoprotein LolB [Usitatibacteraceae bacterium]